ncbi:MAG: succinate--CoA ligase subunit alpha [Dehalococcoidia bacterium]|nr:succinate--CoA ligase subunit alpha [Dehalococcoidia bacterium]
MSILINENTRLCIQGITGGEGTFHARACIEYGTKIVAGMTPNKGGTLWENKVPVFNTMQQAVKETGANASMIFVPAPAAADAIFEAADAGIATIVCITEGIPTIDMMAVKNYLKGKNIRLVGPNCPGVISPGKCKAGIMIASAFSPGKVGLCSRSGTLTYEVAAMLTEMGIGQSTCVGIGGDPIIGSNFVDILDLFQKDPDTEAIVMIGEIGGSAEQEAAAFIQKNVTKPMASFIAGSAAPPGRRMGHAGAIITGTAGRASEKKKALAAVGVKIADSPAEIPAKIKEAMAAR